MSKVSELRAMYNPPSLGTKPSTAAPKSVVGKWNPGGSDATNNASPAPKSFLHAATKNNTAPWAQNTSPAAPKKPWEQKKHETEPKNIFNSASNDSDSKTNRPAWQKSNDVKKTSSFSAAGRERPGVFKKPDGNQNSSTPIEDNIPAWKRNMQKSNPPEDNIPAWKRNQQNSSAKTEENVPSWKKNQADKNDSASGSVNSAFNKMNFNKPSEAVSKPAWAVNQHQNEDEKLKTQPSSTPPSRKQSFLDKAKTTNLNNDPPSARPGMGTRNKFAQNKANDVSDKPTLSPGISRFRPGSTEQTPPPPPPQKPSVEGAGSGGTVSRGPSFLRSQRPAVTPVSSDQSRRKRSIPADVYHKPPPAKPRKPPHARLPGEKGQPDAPPPPPKGNDSFGPRRNASSFISKHSQGRNTNVSPNKPLPTSPSSSNSLMPPGGDEGFPRPPSPNKLRNLPPTPPQPDSDIYDDTTDVPPPLPSMPWNPPPAASTDEIPTWDDEDEQEQLYDETPDAGGAPPPIPEEEEGDEMYEDLDQYSKFKGLPNIPNGANPPPVPKEDKPRKEIDKKEKAIRKKFSLPLDGDILAEAVGFIRTDVKGFHKMALRANEKVDVVRMSNNPKGKWLIRTENGTYGYADPDNINTDPYAQRRQPPVPQSQFGAPNLPPTPGFPPGAQNFPPPLPGKIPGGDDDDGIYDETPENEELYEALG